MARTGDRETISVSGGVAISGLEPIFTLKDTTRRLIRRLELFFQVRPTSIMSFLYKNGDSRIVRT